MYMYVYICIYAIYEHMSTHLMRVVHLFSARLLILMSVRWQVVGVASVSFSLCAKKSEERAYIKKQKQKQKQFRNYSTTVVDLLPFRFSLVLLLRVCTLSSAAFDFYTCSSLSGYIIYMSRLRIWLLSRETWTCGCYFCCTHRLFYNFICLYLLLFVFMHTLCCSLLKFYIV